MLNGHGPDPDAQAASRPNLPVSCNAADCWANSTQYLHSLGNDDEYLVTGAKIDANFHQPGSLVQVRCSVPVHVPLPMLVFVPVPDAVPDDVSACRSTHSAAAAGLQFWLQGWMACWSRPRLGSTWGRLQVSLSLSLCVCVCVCVCVFHTRARARTHAHNTRERLQVHRAAAVTPLAAH